VEARAYDLRTELRERFANAAVDARRVDVVIDGGRVILLGVVSDDLARLLAEDIAWSLPEVTDCENHLAVQLRAPTGGGLTWPTPSSRCSIRRRRRPWRNRPRGCFARAWAAISSSCRSPSITT
jgi:hypothetical protein